MPLSIQSATVFSSSFDSATASLTASFTLAGANVDRKGLSVYNDSTQSLYIQAGPSGSSTNFMLKLPGGALYELLEPSFTGIITGAFVATGTGKVWVVEFGT
jgi:hypothetical protein